MILICGKNDQFCSIEDCKLLKEFLEKQNSLADYIECERDHLTILSNGDHMKYLFD